MVRLLLQTLERCMRAWISALLNQVEQIELRFDIAKPNDPITVADFKKLAQKAITEIAARGRLPILVGGTGLYVDAVIFDFQFRPVIDHALRQELSGLTVEALQKRLRASGIALPENKLNPRHLIRSLESNGTPAKRKPLRDNTLVVGLIIERDVLQQRIEKRVDAMVNAGLVDEVTRLGEEYGWEIEALQTPGYKAFRGYVTDTITLEQAKQQFIRNDLALAKRQRTWFKRNESIHWIREQGEVVDLITTLLNK
jgi:tRNA dimethylallyltransferase